MNYGSRKRSKTSRALFAVAASILLNAALWTLASPLFTHVDAKLRQHVIVSVLHIQRRRPASPRRRSTPRPQRTIPTSVPKLVAKTPPKLIHPRYEHPHRLHPKQHVIAPPAVQRDGSPAMSFSHHQAATIKLPANWGAQDLANGAAANTTLWLDFKKAKGAFVPRVFLMRLKTAYLSEPSLTGAVNDIQAALKPDRARIFASKPQRFCGGTLDGWFLSYERPGEDLPGDYENVIFMKGSDVYRIIYSRPAGQPEDAQTRAALDAICPA